LSPSTPVACASSRQRIAPDDQRPLARPELAAELRSQVFGIEVTERRHRHAGDLDAVAHAEVTGVIHEDPVVLPA
jgi:hypothetical protein